MLVICWSPKGGSGTSVVAAALALDLAERGDVLLVDLAGDQAAILGIDAPAEGVHDWLAAPADVAPDALAGVGVAVASGLSLVGPGTGPIGGAPLDGLALSLEVMASGHRTVVVDAGSGDAVDRAWWPPTSQVVTVVRACYLALRRLRPGSMPSGSVVLIDEDGRSLRPGDVASALGMEVVRLQWDPAVARAVDAGLLASRRPRSLRRLRGAVAVATPQ